MFFSKTLLPLVLAPFSLLAQTPVEYQLRFPNAAHHEAQVRVTFRDVTEPVLRVVMSRASPGRYAVEEFAKNVYAFRATDERGRTLAITRPNPSEWDVAGGGGTVLIEYTVFGDRADGTYDAIDETHAHLNLPATLAWARGYENRPASVRFDLAGRPGWKIATELQPHPDGTWWAPNLEMLMDGPTEISAHTTLEWTVEDARFRLALHHSGSDAEAAAYAQMCQTVVNEAEGVFGALPKYDGGTYTFLVDYLPYVSNDGMEHRDSTVITGKADLRSSALDLIDSVSHEFFHSWNVRRIRPRSLEPFDFEHANLSGELWFAEGFTNYYGPLILERAGIHKLNLFLEDMSSALNEVLTLPGRNQSDVIGMSLLAPFVDGAAHVDPTNFDNTFISYYSYGQALAFGIDLSIRQRFPGKSLDDWMRAMWREHPDIDKPYTLDDLEKTLGEATGDPAFAHEIFARHIVGMEPMDYASLVRAAGLELCKRNPGGASLGNPKLEFTNNLALIHGGTRRGTPLYAAGLDDGDRILRWDGKMLHNEEELAAWLGHHKPGDRVRLKVITRAGMDETTATLSEDSALELVTEESLGQDVTPAMRRLRQEWLSSKSLHPLPKLGRAGSILVSR